MENSSSAYFSEDITRCLLKTLFYSEAVKIYNLKPNPLQKGGGRRIKTVQHSQKDKTDEARSGVSLP